MGAWALRLEVGEHGSAGAGRLLAGPAGTSLTETSLHHRPQCESRTYYRPTSFVLVRSNGSNSSGVCNVAFFACSRNVAWSRVVGASLDWFCTVLALFCIVLQYLDPGGPVFPPLVDRGSDLSQNWCDLSSEL